MSKRNPPYEIKILLFKCDRPLILVRDSKHRYGEKPMIEELKEAKTQNEVIKLVTNAGIKKGYNFTTEAFH